MLVDRVPRFPCHFAVSISTLIFVQVSSLSCGLKAWWSFRQKRPKTISFRLAVWLNSKCHLDRSDLHPSPLLVGSDPSVNKRFAKCLSTSICCVETTYLWVCGKFGLRLTRAFLAITEQGHQGLSTNMYQSRHTVSENSCWNGGYCKTGSRNVTPRLFHESSSKIVYFLPLPDAASTFWPTIQVYCGRFMRSYQRRI